MGELSDEKRHFNALAPAFDRIHLLGEEPLSTDAFIPNPRHHTLPWQSHTLLRVFLMYHIVDAVGMHAADRTVCVNTLCTHV